MAWYEDVPKVLGSIVPDLDADPKHQLRWRWSMAGMVIIMASAQIIHTLIACGWLAVWGVSGFAYASDVDRIALAQQRTEIRQIKDTLIDQERAYCRAKDASKPTFFIYQLILDAMKDWREVTGEVWERPSCQELGE